MVPELCSIIHFVQVFNLECLEWNVISIWPVLRKKMHIVEY